jgi:type II secretory pathway component PulF
MSEFPERYKTRAQPKVWRSPWKRMLIFMTAWGLIFLSFLGIILPILPGIVFFVAGIYLLSLESAWLNRQIERFCNRFPKAGEIIHDAQSRTIRLLRRLLRED